MEKSTDKKAVNNDKLADKPRANPNRHKGCCTICKSSSCKELEDRYLDGESVYDLQREMKFDNKTIYLHVKAFDLDKKRDNSTLNLVNRLISKVDVTKLGINVKTYVSALQLRAKLKGEIIEKHEVKEVLDDYTNEQLIVIAEQSAAVLRERTVVIGDQVEPTPGVPEPIRETPLIPPDSSTVQ